MYEFRWQTDEENWRLYCLFADFMASFATSKERIAWRVKSDIERAQAASEGRLLDWTVNEYWTEIEETVKMAGAKGRGRPSAKATQAQQLIDALTFIEDGTNDFQDWQRYIRMSGNMAISFNGQIAAGHPIVEEVSLCPQLDKLRDALKRCGNSLVISETPAGQLSIKGQKIKALVPCIRSAEDLPFIQPDMPIERAQVSDVLKEAFKICGKLSSEAGEHVTEASLLLEANACTGMGKGRFAMVQFWHGLDLPPHMVLPKTFCDAVAKQSKPITGFGCSWQGDIVGSVTIWFEGGAWIKTQTYQDRWPDIYAVLNQPSYPADLPAGLFDAVEAMTKFSDDGKIVFDDDRVMSHTNDAVGAQYEAKGLQGGKVFDGKAMKELAGHATKMDLTTYPDRAYFVGGKEHPLRGVILCYSSPITHSDPQPQEAPGEYDQTPTYEACPHCNDAEDGCEHCT